MAEREPLDEDAVWAEIVASYNAETADPERDRPAGARPDGPDGDDPTAAHRESSDDDPPPDPWPTLTGPPINSITVLSAGTGPRDWHAIEPDDDMVDDEEEGDEDEDHFIPPEPPPLPDADVTTRFAWLAAVGGPLLLIGAILFRQPLSWWVLTLGVGGFLGGFATLIVRMRDDEDGFDDPGRGAVV